MRTLVLLGLGLAPPGAAAQVPIRSYAEAVEQRTTRLAPKLDYTLTVPDDRTAYLVEPTITNPPDPAVLRIPAWAPGAYRLLDSGKNISAFIATTPDGMPLATTRDDDLTWRVATAGDSRISGAGT